MILKFLKSGYQKLKQALSKARSKLGEKIRSLFESKIDDQTIDELEKLFYEADLGVHAAMELTEQVHEIYRQNPSIDSRGLIQEIQKILLGMLTDIPATLTPVAEKDLPRVILVVGVNGNGKTTSIAKLAHKFTQEGKKVLLAAADTFRAAATEQLELWADRLGVEIVKGKRGSDPAAVAFDAATAAKARGVDVLLIDTAGRLHTKKDLMQELEKIKRSCNKVHGGSPHETLLVLDATTGQNAVDQAKVFHSFTPVTGLILTKLDGTSKGGVVVNIHQQLKLPVKFVGLGESIEDLEPFDPKLFTAALLGIEP